MLCLLSSICISKIKATYGYHRIRKLQIRDLTLMDNVSHFRRPFRMHEASCMYILLLNNFNSIYIMHFVCHIIDQSIATECLLCARNRQRQAIDVTESVDSRDGHMCASSRL